MAPLNKSPSSSKPTVIRHFTDPKHRLHLVDIPNEFLCNGCSALGFGTRYRCDICDVDLHDFCGTCPSAIQLALHPKHPLTLVNKPVNDRFCDLCGDLVYGLVYTCEGCEFDVHPLCSQLPPHVSLRQHSQHLLKLQAAKPAPCALCYKGCTAWRYRCEPCNLDVHLECLLTGDDAQTPAAPPPQHQRIRSVSTPPPPPPHPLNRSVSMPVPPRQQHQQQMGHGSCAVGLPMGGGGGYSMNGMASSDMMMMMHNHDQMIMNNHHQQQQQMMMMNNHYQQPMMMMSNQQQHPMMMMMMNNQHQQQPPPPEKDEAKKSTGSKKRKIYGVVARLAINAVTTGLIGVPLA